MEENAAACVAVGDLEGAEVGLDQAVHQADHRKGVEDFPADLLVENSQGHLEVHLPGYLMEIKTLHFKKHSRTMFKDPTSDLGYYMNHSMEKEGQTDL